MHLSRAWKLYSTHYSVICQDVILHGDASVVVSPQKYSLPPELNFVLLLCHNKLIKCYHLWFTGQEKFIICCFISIRHVRIVVLCPSQMAETGNVSF